MHRPGFDLQLTQYDDRGCRATFYTTGMEHSPTSATGSGWAKRPWRAVQRAALTFETWVSRVALALGLLTLLLASACSTLSPSYRDERFVILSSGDFTAQDVERVREQLEVGLKALERYTPPAPRAKFPIVVNLWSGSGVSHSYHGRGPIELFWVKEMRSPIIHELTHVMAGYTASNGHWTQEGFASYMQDEYGEDRAFPTAKMAHALVKVLSEEASLLPMEYVMRDRNRQTYFGTRTPWERWLAYTQSTSLCRYLIERYGRERFVQVYDVPFERVDFEKLYEKPVGILLDEWLSHVRALPLDGAAYQYFVQMKRLRVR